MKKIAGIIAMVALCFVVHSGKGNEGHLKEVSAFTDSSSEESEIGVASVGLSVRAKSAYLIDYGTGTVIYAQNETARLPIASMCKIMTLDLCFEAIDNGILTMDEEILVSEKAASMGGSQVFLEANAKYPVKELIKSIVVCSANDSCVALAEKIAGSEAVFTEKMNEKAKELGANDTLFANCTGLPKEPQYSCAKDVSVMLKDLLTHKEYFSFGKVWMDKFTHPKGRYTEITNTNKLVRFYDGCDGGKTGFTNQAGFCLASTAIRNDMRIISVVIGAENSANRFEDTRTMFDYAFANYTMQPIAKAGEPLDKTAIVCGGKKSTVTLTSERSAYAFLKRGEKADVQTEFFLNPLRAPCAQGKYAGQLVLYKNGLEVDRVNLLTMESVARANFFDCFREVAKGFNARK